jgi:broad specificity phosphatase PhoE
LTTYLIVRHGTTEWVDTQFLHGITDIPLNEKGRAQAAAAAKALADSGAKKIYTSPLLRCAQTADAISQPLGLKPIVNDGLTEIDFGWLEGRKIRDHDNGEYGKLVEFFDHYMFMVVRALSGETRAKLAKRVMPVWQKILEENPSGTMIIVTHSGVINTLLTQLFGKQYMNGNAYYHLSPAGITEIDVDQDLHARLVRLNDSSHIPDELT